MTNIIKTQIQNTKTFIKDSKNTDYLIVTMLLYLFIDISYLFQTSSNIIKLIFLIPFLYINYLYTQGIKGKVIFAIFWLIYVIDRVLYQTIPNDIFKDGINENHFTDFKMSNQNLIIETVKQYLTTNIIIELVKDTAIIVSIIYVLKRIKQKHKVLNIKNILVFYISFYLMWLLVKGYNTSNLPIPFKGLFVVQNQVIKKFNAKEKKDKYQIQKVKKPINKIVVIMDESISYNFTSEKNLDEILGKGNYLNIGPIISNTNCSNSAYKHLMIGTWNENDSTILDYVTTEEKAIVVENQSMQTIKTNKENISWVNSLKYDKINRDEKILNEVENYLKDNDYVFILKNGAHYKYKSNLTSKTKSNKLFIKRLKQKYPNASEKSINSVINYERNITKSFDNYLKLLKEKYLNNKDYENTLFIYTSDHGQNIKSYLKNDNSLLHCDYANIQSYLVPGIIITSNKKLLSEIKNIKQDYLNKKDLTGFILEMMGYDKEQISKYYSNFNYKIKPEYSKIYINKEVKKVTSEDFKNEKNFF